MREGVQAHPAQLPAGVVTEPVRRVRVHELMDRDPEHDREEEPDERDRIARRVPDRSLKTPGKEVETEEDERDEEHRVQAAARAPVAASDHYASLWGGGGVG